MKGYGMGRGGKHSLGGRKRTKIVSPVSTTGVGKPQPITKKRKMK